MKKTVAILLIAVMALSFVACAGKKIIGKWELTDYQGEDELGARMKGYTFEFKDDGTYTIAGMPAGTYEVKGNKLFFNGDKDEYYKLSISGNTMKISGSEDTMTFKKK
jgi:hypothetical protein